MNHQTFTLDDILPAEQTRLVRLCAYLSGDPAVADDLAQETLIEAWRNRHKLVDPQGYSAWLSAIARNVCLRWKRSRGRELSQLTSPTEATPTFNLDSIAFDEFDLEIDLERKALATLLDRALELLPADTRATLIAKYISDAPLTEIAAHLGLSENTVAVRLHRGKLALHKVLTTHLRSEAAGLGLIPPEDDGWQETRLWCVECGQHRLLGNFDTVAGSLFLRCPACYDQHGQDFNHTESLRRVFGPVKGFKPALSRLMTWADSFYLPGLKAGVISCSRCNQQIQPRLCFTPYPFPFIDASCPACGGLNTHSLCAHALGLPEGQQFWREHPRLRTLPYRQVEVEGHPASITTFESVTGSARFEVILALDTFTLLRVITRP